MGVPLLVSHGEWVGNSLFTVICILQIPLPSYKRTWNIITLPIFANIFLILIIFEIITLAFHPNGGMIYNMTIHMLQIAGVMKVSKLLIRIFLYSDWIRRFNALYSIRMPENPGQKKTSNPDTFDVVLALLNNAQNLTEFVFRRSNTS